MIQGWDSARKAAVLERMLLIRRFEECVVGLFLDHQFRAHYHLYIGQEATGVAVMEALSPSDRLATTHRNHGHTLARGSDPRAALAEILGRASGLNGGRGGTMHLCDAANGFIATSAIVGGCIGLATGAAFALKKTGGGAVAAPFAAFYGDGSLEQAVSFEAVAPKNPGGGAIAAAFFGDGSLEEGVSFESLNFAALWSLPVVFVCEDNSPGALGSAGGGFPTSVTAARALTAIPAAFGIAVETVDGRDVDLVYAAAARAVDRCRSGNGPAFLHVVTKRWAGTQPLWPALVTGETDVAMAWDESGMAGKHEDWYRNQDPVLRYARKLLAAGDVNRDALVAMDGRARARIAEAREAALQSPYPAPESALNGVFA